MEAIAKGRYLRSSVLKLRRVAKIVRNKNVTDSLAMLQLMPQKTAKMIYKVVFSARANLLNQYPEVRPDDLFVKEIYVNQGPALRRMKPRARGRADIMKRPQSHLTVIVGTKEEA